MEWITDPSAWLGLATLIVLEIVLGIDNLVFIAILADKLPPHQRDRARIIGLSLALLMRLALLASIAWVVSLTTPLFSIMEKGFSGRDLILWPAACSSSSRRPWSCTHAWKAAGTITKNASHTRCSGR